MISKKGLDIIKKHEGFRSRAYLCPAGKWTIGYGNTLWEDGKPVQPGQTITRARAESLLQFWANKMTNAGLLDMPKTTIQALTQNQVDALGSFIYNVGVTRWNSSTLKKLVSVNPNNPAIRAEFNKWIRGGGKVLPGLKIRRKEEADLYFLQ